MNILLYSLFFLFVCASNGYAQSIVKGTVRDVTGSPLPGVNVMLNGVTRSGTLTDKDGQYSIHAKEGDILSFSYMGMVSQKIKIFKRSIIDVVMKDKVSSLDEIVVVGYGTQKKIHLTGSVASISSKELLKAPASNITQMMVGKLPGLITTQNNGAPGADGVTTLVRGYSSYNGGGSPLVIIDGVERAMSWIDPADVESVTILKDAAAAAVYGMRAASGVILITTKRGSKSKKAVVNYKGSVSFLHTTQLPKFMNGTQYMQYYNEARILDGKDTSDSPYFTDEEIAMTTNGDPTDGYENTNWQKPLYRTTLMHQHNLSISGGNDFASYYISGGFMQQNGFIKGHHMKRANFRSNIDARPSNNLKVSVDILGRVESPYRPGGNSYSNQAYNNVVGVLLYSLPFVPMEYNGLPTSGYRGGSNPLYAANHSGFEKDQNIVLETSAKVEWSLPWVKGLKASLFGSWDYKSTNSKTFSYAYKLMKYYVGSKSYNEELAGGLTENGNMYVGKAQYNTTVMRPSIEYSNKFGKHEVGALFLYEETKINSDQLTGTRTDFPLFDLAELSYGTSVSGLSSNSGSSGRSVKAGYVGRVNYVYDNKYLAEASFRYDGSYHFAKGHRWGFFPSFSAGWVMSEEPFFKRLFPKIDRFKIRGSVGVLGNDNVSEFLYLKTYSWQTSNVAFGSTPTAENTLYNSNSYPMENLTWEKCRTSDLGFELTAWGGLLGIEFDAFYKYTYDILQSSSGTYPLSLGGHYPSIENSGTFDDRGFEIVLKHTNKIGNVLYNLNGNLSFAKNRILSKIESANVLPWQSVKGRSIGSVLGLKSAGLFQTQEEIDNAPTPPSGTLQLGGIRYVDMNGDGKITSDDEVYVAKSSVPEMMFSFTADATWKGFDFSAQFQGAALCNKMLQGDWDNGAMDMTPLTKPFYGNYDNAPLYLVENSWTPDHTNAKYPRLSTVENANNAWVSDYWRKDGAYLRLKSATIGYTFPKKWITHAGISNLRVYVAGTNLLTITQFKYLDPESPNVLQGYYPQQRTYSVGIDVSF